MSIRSTVRHYFDSFRKTLYENFEATFNVTLGYTTFRYVSVVPHTWSATWRDSGGKITIRSPSRNGDWEVVWYSSALAQGLGRNYQLGASQRTCRVSPSGLKGRNPYYDMNKAANSWFSQFPTRNEQSTFEHLVEYVTERVASRYEKNYLDCNYFGDSPSRDKNIDTWVWEFCVQNAAALHRLKRSVPNG